MALRRVKKKDMYIHIYTCTFTDAYAYTDIHVHMRTRIPIHVYVYTYLYMYIYIYGGDVPKDSRSKLRSVLSVLPAWLNNACESNPLTALTATGTQHVPLLRQGISNPLAHPNKTGEDFKYLVLEMGFCS